MTTEPLKIPVKNLKGVGGVLASRLKRLGITTVEDLLWHLPSRYEDYRTVTPIRDLQPPMQATVHGTLALIHNKRSPRKRMMITEALIDDHTETLKIVWFHQPFLTKTLSVGDEIYFSGKVDQTPFGIQMTNPVYEKAQKKTENQTHTARLVPIYPTTENLTQKQMRFFVREALPFVDNMLDPFDAAFLNQHHLASLPDAIRSIHFPKNQQDVTEAERRIKFNDLFFVQLFTQTTKASFKKLQAEPITFYEQETRDFVSRLPFTLTPDQKKCAWQILQDLAQAVPMNRLLEGDVGSGKTVVAAIAMKNVALNGKQSIFLAPTEILAQQHFETLTALLPLQRIGLLTHSQQRINKEKSSKKEIIEHLAANSIDIVIGTHALLQERVQFLNLALAIVDEQHRFGVKQRKTLREESGNSKTLPHLLSMTATPIPRTLALTLYGDLDLSIIKIKPPGRLPIITRVVEAREREKTYAFVGNEMRAGNQIFVICPLISESDTFGAKSVEEELENLKKRFPLTDIRALHGRMKPQEKETIMRAFRNRDFPMLVSTAVVEVGVDIPNATVMLIEGAERFGLAQLHQFRGRVGRSTQQSYCFLFDEGLSAAARARLELFARSQDGFALAEYDLQLRGPGEVYGTKQSGMPLFRLATLADAALIAETQGIAKNLVEQDPELGNHPPLKKALEDFTSSLHLE